jgi:hypothetical protein
MSKAIMKGFQVLIVTHEMLSYYWWIYCIVVHLLCEMPLAVFDFANIFIFSLVEHLVLLTLFFFFLFIKILEKKYLFGLWDLQLYQTGLGRVSIVKGILKIPEASSYQYKMVH